MIAIAISWIKIVANSGRFWVAVRQAFDRCSHHMERSMLELLLAECSSAGMGIELTATLLRRRLPPSCGHPAKPACIGMQDFESLDGGDDWDDDFATDLIGCTILVGLTYVDHQDQLLRREQLFGTVLSVDRRTGIVIRQVNGEEFVIAPALEAIEAANPGIYQLADKDESVENPNFTAMLTVRSPLRS